MKNFSFKVFYVAVFAPSILYVLTLPYCERFLEKATVRAVEEKLIQRDFELLGGSISLYDEVNRNVSSVLTESLPVRWGVHMRLRVVDPQGEVVYPHYARLPAPFRETKGLGKRAGPIFDEKGFVHTPGGADVETFLENLSAYIHGMKISAVAKVPVTSWLGSGLLLFYILSTVTVLYLYYRRMSDLEQRRMYEMTARLENERRTVSAVAEELEKARQSVAEVQAQEHAWLKEVERLEKEKIELESELLETLEETEEQKERIDALEERVTRKPERKVKRTREDQRLLARFTRLYRNLEVDQKVVDDLVRLGDEKIKLRAEEMLKRLNDQDPSLSVRRKIAGVERCEAYELGFGSSGRIYYSQSEKGHYKVLRIGTKATQKKDLAYLQGRAK